MKFIEFKKIPRLSREVIITEKIDGTNASIFIEHVPTQAAIEGLSYDEVKYGDTEILYCTDEWTIRAGSRTKWITPKDDNMGFAKWVVANAVELTKLGPGQHFGEWWGQGIQRGYGLKEKRFSLFNTSRWGDPDSRPECCGVVPTLFSGMFSTLDIEMTLTQLATTGSVAAPEFMKPEGIVIYHTAGDYYFKKTIEKDESPKGVV